MYPLATLNSKAEIAHIGFLSMEDYCTPFVQIRGQASRLRMGLSALLESWSRRGELFSIKYPNTEILKSLPTNGYMCMSAYKSILT